jgi:UDP-N-acetylglucosamine acyltransferase
MTVHETAIVSPSAILGNGVEIGPYSIIGDHVEIGDGTRIGSHVIVNGPTRIGKANRIYQFASIGDDPQDKKYAGEPTRLEIGDGNTIREYCTISRGTVQDEGVTRVGDDNWIMAYVHIAHDCRIGSHIVFANNATLAGHVHVGDWAILAGFSGAHQYCRIGPHSFLGMYSGVAGDVPAYVMMAGQPPEPRGINSEGLKRRGFTAEQIRNIRNAYRIVYRQGLKLSTAIEQVESLASTRPELQLFLESLRASERGIVR